MSKQIGNWELTQDTIGVRAVRRFDDGRQIVASIAWDQEELWIDGDHYVPVKVVAQLLEWRRARLGAEL